MRLYALTSTCVADWPATSLALISHDREAITKAWVDHVLDALGYPDDNPDPDEVHLVRNMAQRFIEDQDDPDVILEWIVGNEGPTDEMVTYEVHVTEVPGLKLDSMWRYK